MSKSTTGCAYWPLTPGSYITYQVNDIVGAFDVPSWELSVESRTPNVGNPIQTITAFATSDPFAGAPPLYQEVYTMSDCPAPCATADLAASLVEGAFAPTGIWYLGEYSNFSQTLILPGEAKITLNPVSGERIEFFSNMVTHGQLAGVAHWAYATVGHYPAWGKFQDCWRTSLIEYDAGAIKAAYNYLFSRGIGMVAFWYVPKPGGNGAGYEYL